jgi:mannose-6-phosphate isomerase-like protein (cupin superfamily)
MQIRRVVTGQRAARSAFASDDLLDGFDFGAGAAWVLWGSDEPARVPNDGAMPRFDGSFPPAGGHRFVVLTLAPGEESEHKLAELLPDVMDPDDLGMHSTTTVDFIVVLDGEIVLELDDGAEVVLRARDCVVQNGTRHRWKNRSGAPATYATVIVGAERG